MQIKKWIIALPLLTVLLSGCSYLELLVYRIDISQGNYVEQEAVNKLRFGMSKEQVQYVMGTPMLVESGYPNKWYYVYHFTHGHEDSIQKNMIANFDTDGKLISIEGDFPASDSFFEAI